VGTHGGVDRDRALHPAVLVVIASYYVLVAVMGGSSHALVIEGAVAGRPRRMRDFVRPNPGITTRGDQR
jgi:hypothetical protein